MKLLRSCLAAASLVILASSTQAARKIVQFNPDISSSTYTIDDNGGPIEITALAADTNEVFQFVCYDDATNAPADIVSLTIPSALSGRVRVQIIADAAPRSFGAASVRILDIDNAAPGELVGLDISNNLGRIGGVACSLL